MVSPSESPAAAAGESSYITSTLHGSYPMLPTITTAHMKARIKLNKGPAAITAILAHTDLLANDLDISYPCSSASSLAFMDI